MRLHQASLFVLFIMAFLLGGQGSALAREWPQRPKIEDYQDFTAFTQAMNAYKSYMHPSSPPSLPELPTIVSPTMRELSATSPEMLDPLSESFPPPLNIVGPEDLDEAVEQARSFIHPVYTAPKRYNRSTSQSFSLPPANPELLARAEIGSILFGEKGDVESLFKEYDSILSVIRAGDNRVRLKDEALMTPNIMPVMLTGRLDMTQGMPGDVSIESFRH